MKKETQKWNIKSMEKKVLKDFLTLESTQVKVQTQNWKKSDIVVEYWEKLYFSKFWEATLDNLSDSNKTSRVDIVFSTTISVN